MTSYLSPKRVAEEYLGLLANQVGERQALLACSAALRLEDELAVQVVQLIFRETPARDLIQRIKALGCIWQEWDGSWYVADDVRPYFLAWLRGEVDPEILDELHELLATAARRRAEALDPATPLDAYRIRSARVEAAFQTSLMRHGAERGGRELLSLWREAEGEAKAAITAAAATLGPEVESVQTELPAAWRELANLSAESGAGRPSSGQVWESLDFSFPDLAPASEIAESPGTYPADEPASAEPQAFPRKSGPSGSGS